MNKTLDESQNIQSKPKKQDELFSTEDEKREIGSGKESDNFQTMNMKYKIKKIHKAKRKVPHNYKNIDPLDVLSNTHQDTIGTEGLNQTLQEGMQEGLSMDNTTCADDPDYMGCDNTKVGNKKSNFIMDSIHALYESIVKFVYIISLSTSLVAISWVDNTRSKDRESSFQKRNATIRGEYEKVIGVKLDPRMVMPSREDVKRVQSHVELFLSALISMYFVYNWFFLIIYEDNTRFIGGAEHPDISIENAQKMFMISLLNDYTGGMSFESILKPFFNKEARELLMKTINSEIGNDPRVNSKGTTKFSSASLFIFLVFFRYAWIFVSTLQHFLFFKLRDICKQENFSFLSGAISVPNMISKEVGFTTIYLICILCTYYCTGTLKDAMLSIASGDIMDVKPSGDFDNVSKDDIKNALKQDINSESIKKLGKYFTPGYLLLIFGVVITVYFFYSLFETFNPTSFIAKIPIFGFVLIILLYIFIVIFSSVLAVVLLFLFFLVHSMFGLFIYGKRYIFEIPELVNEFTKEKIPKEEPTDFFPNFFHKMKIAINVLYSNIFYLALIFIIVHAGFDYTTHIKSSALFYGMMIITAIALLLIVVSKFAIDKLLEIKLENAENKIFDETLVNDVVQSIRKAQEAEMKAKSEARENP